MNTDRGDRPMFGQIDPYCLLAFFPMLLIAVLLMAEGAWLPGIGCVLLAGLILAFDSWVNRPETPASPRTSAPQRRPARDDAPWARQARPRRQPDRRDTVL